MPDFEVTFESTPKGTPLRKASDKVCMPQWVQVLKERLKTRSVHPGEWRSNAADERTTAWQASVS